MRKLVSAATLTAILVAAPAAFAAASNSAPGTIVIVFKDGHRQAYKLADIERVEFPTAEVPAVSNSTYPSRGHFLGKWEVGDGAGSNFTITLEEDGNAMRSIGNVHGTWTYTDGEADIRWDDGAQDAIRRVGQHFQKFAYRSGKSFSSVPDNVTNARSITPKPI
jgi:hypothetical protein